ncbi:hypothetical protein JAAARDRAFT_402733 [Jaapia argillacea MUCL 33604]|uniref:Uncharacterized protein n=1 Tax=Jaapia argillacea MUCL 33604 TaxID=933084 RepID=A0A067PK57_9AGAM|nr:hypothetical protein JAAARDRAFT_402733 [Jaapia argillacea MUCL 33604]
MLEINNTSYKEHSPTRPCSKSWVKYSKSCTTATAHSPWTPSSKDPPLLLLPSVLPRLKLTFAIDTNDHYS